MIESRQVRLERDLKQLELQFGGMGEELALRPLKTDVISAIAQQELAVEACASQEALGKLEALVRTCASSDSLNALQSTVRDASEKARAHAHPSPAPIREHRLHV